MKLNRLTMLLTGAGSAFCLAACNNGSSSGSNSTTGSNQTQILQADSANLLNAATANPCLSAKLTLADPKNLWYSAVTLVLTNSCASPQVLNKGSLIGWKSQDSNGKSVNISSDFGLVPGWSPTISNFSNSLGVTSGSLSDNLTIAANGSANYSGGVNINGAPYNSTLANGSITINGSQPTPQYGALNINFNAAGVCTASCAAATVTVTNSSKQQVKSFNFSSWNTNSTTRIESLPVDQYTVTIANSNNYAAQANPNPSGVSANSRANTAVTFSAIQQTGDLSVKIATKQSLNLANLPDSIPVKLYNGSSLIGVYQVSLLTGTTDLGNMPLLPAGSSYTLLFPSLGDAVSGVYYAGGSTNISLTANVTNNAAFNYVKSSMITKPFTLNVSGLAQGVSSTFNFTDGLGVIYATNSGVANGALKLNLPGIDLVYPTATAAGYTSDIVRGTSYNTATSSSASVLFSVVSNTATVAGWPAYLAMGTITNNGYFVGANSENGLDRPSDAIFKYAGSNGAGDQGFILFPQTISRTILEAEYYSESTGHLTKPVMVEYTLQLSGGGNELPDLQPDVMAYHFINLATDAAYLEANGSNGKKYSTYGSIVLNPDALGFIQQMGMDGTSTSSGVNLATASYPVNQEVAKAVCYLTNTVNYSWTFSNTGQTIKYSGTPIQVAQGITNQANGAWVMGDTYADWSDNAAPAWYAACKSNPTNPLKINIPSFTNNFAGWVQANNWLIKQFGPHVTFGWHENVSMLPTGSRWIHQYNSHLASTANNIQTNVSTPTVNSLNTFKVFTGAYKPDFIVFDRYEVDDTNNLSFFYNDSDWDNLLTMVGQISKSYNNLPVMLWQMPGGHLQLTNDVDTRGGHGGALGNYFFGDSNLSMGTSCAASNLQAYWCGLTITSSDYPVGGSVYSYLTMNGYKWNQDNGKLALAAQNNVFAILWGGGTGPTTGINHLVSGDNDNGWLAAKVVNYYKNPQSLRK